jgi:hypothetical protein
MCLKQLQYGRTCHNSRRWQPGRRRTWSETNRTPFPARTWLPCLDTPPSSQAHAFAAKKQRKTLPTRPKRASKVPPSAPKPPGKASLSASLWAAKGKPILLLPSVGAAFRPRKKRRQGWLTGVDGGGRRSEVCSFAQERPRLSTPRPFLRVGPSLPQREEAPTWGLVGEKVAEPITPRSCERSCHARSSGSDWLLPWC